MEVCLKFAPILAKVSITESLASFLIFPLKSFSEFSDYQLTSWQAALRKELYELLIPIISA